MQLLQFLSQLFQHVLEILKFEACPGDALLVLLGDNESGSGQRHAVEYAFRLHVFAGGYSLLFLDGIPVLYYLPGAAYLDFTEDMWMAAN